MSESGISSGGDTTEWSSPTRVVSTSAQPPQSRSTAPPPPELPKPPRRRSTLKVALSSLLVVLAVVGVGWVVLVSSVLGVRTVQVTGTKLLTADQVRAAADITRGAPLARLDTDAIAARVQKLAEVRAVSVEVSYPSTVRIQVTERTAVGYQRGGDDSVHLVDASGKAFRAVTEPPEGQPELSPATAELLRPTAEVCAALPPTLRAQVESVEADSPHSITLNLSDGRTVLWGASTDNAAKATLMAALLNQPGDTFDISASGIVVVR